MRKGILVTKKGTKEGYFPIFIDDREFVHSVLAEAMEQWKQRETRDAVHDGMEFFEIANAIGKERTKSHQFIGAESIPERELEPCIQAADFIAGALHYYYRTDDATYSSIINPKVTLAFDYFYGPQK